MLQLMQAIHASMQESEGQPAGQQNATPAAQPPAGSRRASALNAEAPELAWQGSDSGLPREPSACLIPQLIHPLDYCCTPAKASLWCAHYDHSPSPALIAAGQLLCYARLHPCCFMQGSARPLLMQCGTVCRCTLKQSHCPDCCWALRINLAHNGLLWLLLMQCGTVYRCTLI